ncbi:putative methyltransferase [Aliarcobacter thereius]|uniref:site-specific DNA-methyltransferase (adenine-specific) n=1 Tax=Aliarcobacter thereius TaxID=544718 RepID=A0A1C0B597_9BACT|nr:site-specific DNA-methyltransferase [Aliarcobacter thereius]OCL97898.1 putative methyltransferase [Aliarcobacter thereius]
MKKNVIEEQSINDNNYKKLKELFPHAVSIDENGKYVIDPQKLQMSLDPSKAEIREDGYGLNWVGKKEAYHSAFSKNYKVLKPLKDDSKNWDETENILIKGDNLDALKILRHNYFEAIKMIYIDPPYNTKNDGFVYNDNFTTSTEQALEELGYDKEYIDYIENIQGAKTHSGWLSFMYPRLLLARDLLKDDGVIFISIDDNEVAQLRLLCDEIFGEENFVANVIWEKKFSPQNDAKWFSDNHDHILVYTKNKEIWRPYLLPRTAEHNERYKNLDNDERGSWTSGDLLRKDVQKSGLYDITTPSGRIVNPPSGRSWRVPEYKYKELVIENRIWFGENGDNVPRLKRFLTDVQDGLVPLTIWKHKDVGHNQDAAKEMRDIFEGYAPFDTPKPTKLISQILKLSTKENDLILDFFAGSGTTAHAVMDLNAQDGGNRKYICVQWAEETPEKSEARKAGYETIFDITKARIDKAGEKIVEGDITKQDLDIGFRTFEIVEDQKQKIYQKSLEDVSQEDLLVMMEKPDISSKEEILYNLFVAETLPLSTKHQELIKDKLYLASNVAFILGDITSDELVEALKDKKECEYITVYSPNISNDKFTLEIESNISKLGIKSDKLRFRG